MSRTLLDDIQEALERATPEDWYVDHKAPPHHGADCIVYIVERKRHGRIARMWSGRSREFQDAKLVALLRNNANPLLAVVRAAAELRKQWIALRGAEGVCRWCGQWSDAGDHSACESLEKAFRTLDPRLLGE